ncbi:hypothetical protein BDZ91DRAFT_723711 [Kalaharituber pfeilii]|nr:hypothetical protein BDZ91DRAFT_723711 [Kalaharituber pfeilii]
MPSTRHSQPPGPDMPLKPARCSQSLPPDIPPGPNIPSKPVHYCSQHFKSKSNSAAEVLAADYTSCYEFTTTVVWAAGGAYKNTKMRKMYTRSKCTYATQAICEPMLCLFGLMDGNSASLRLPPPLQTRDWKRLSSGRVLDQNYLIARL